MNDGTSVKNPRCAFVAMWNYSQVL